MLRTSTKKSYLGFPCGNCKRPIAALSILADLPTPEFTFGDARTVELSCPTCGHEGSYKLNQVRRFEEHQIH
jgi:hypothetical protein